MAFALGRIEESRVQYHEEVLNHFNLKYVLPSQVDAGRILALFERDKKAQDGITFVLDGENGVELVKVENQNILRNALEVIQ